MSDLPANRAIWFSAIALTGLASDLVSKQWVFGALGLPGQAPPFFEGWCSFRFYTSVNEGALWGMGQGLTWLFAALSVVAVIGVLTWLFKYGAAKSLWLTVALSLILAGTSGNLFDRLGLHGLRLPNGKSLYGVRDFLLFTFGDFNWPVFNFADVFLVIGAIMLAIHSMKSDLHERAEKVS
jgi:signal peptidase II